MARAMYSLPAAGAIALLLIVLDGADANCYEEWINANNNLLGEVETTLSKCCPEPTALPTIGWDGLQRLTSIDLTECATLIGGLPEKIAEAKSLNTIRIRNIEMTGSIPDLHDLYKLTHLELSWTGYSGKFPVGSLPKSLNHIDISGNDFTEFLAGLNEFSRLTSLDIGHNKFRQVPAEFGQLQRIRTLSIESNLFTGRIPAELADLSDLSHIKLGNNRFHGGLPAFHDSVKIIASELDHSFVDQEGSCKGDLHDRCSVSADWCNFWDFTCCKIGGTCPKGLDDRSCTTSAREVNGFECSGANYCVEGVYGTGEFGPKGICCGGTGVNIECLSRSAFETSALEIWCMECEGHSAFGLQGCGWPVKIPGERANELPARATHVVCEKNEGNIGGAVGTMTGENFVANDKLEYLSLHGIEVSFARMEVLGDKYRNLKHLDLSGAFHTFRVTNSLILSSDITWSSMEYLNVSTLSFGCAVNGAECFHTALAAIVPKLRVIDLSNMGMNNPTSLKSLGSATSLEELYLSNNNLDDLPANFFDGLTKLTKLRIRGNDILSPLPNFIYERPAELDCDVPRGAIVQGTSAPTGTTDSRPVDKGEGGPTAAAGVSSLNAGVVVALGAIFAYLH